VKYKLRFEVPCSGNNGTPGGAPFGIFLAGLRHNRQPTPPMNRPIHAATPGQRSVRGVHNRVSLLVRNIASDKFDTAGVDDVVHGFGMVE